MASTNNLQRQLDAALLEIEYLKSKVSAYEKKQSEEAQSLFDADGKPLGPLTLETAPKGTRWWHEGDRGFLSEEHSDFLNKAFASGKRDVSRGGYNWTLKDDGTGTQTYAGAKSNIVQLIPG